VVEIGGLHCLKNEVEELKRYVEHLKEKVRRKNRTSNKARLN
jgi:hypothetical protein